ncbi:MAG: helix-hairpin-helix domain-containing protein [Marinilabiliaceae bacterium]|nr:helix-hairpin-helix domain-containing protein [Marinilabiliaceae bacterium]
MKVAFFTIILLLFFTFAKTQNLENVYEWAAEIVESIAEDLEDGDYSYMIEDLVRLYHDPININSANRDDLSKIFFLKDKQIENILFHRYTNGLFYSIYELQTVEGFDRHLIEMIEPLIFFGETETAPTPRKHYFRGDLFLRTRFTAETPRGFTERNGQPPAYKGHNAMYYTRFEASPLRNFSMGFVAKNDPGEPMFSNQIATFDYISGYVSWKPNTFLKQVIIGQYKISSGQGLVLQTGMRTGKTGNASSIRNRNSGFKPGLSASDATGMSGIILSLGNEKFSINPFLSVKQKDGRLREDSLGNQYITGIRTDGYHRTTTELETRHNTREDIFGVQMRYFTKYFTLEAGHVEYRLEYPVIPDESYYNQYYFNGQQNGNSWFSIEGGLKNIFLFSEIAFNESLHPAIWAGLLTSPANRFNWVLSYRYFPLDFQAPLGNPFAESPRGSGESGFYSGIDLELPYNLVASAYFDYFKFKWLRYQIKAPSDGYDASVYLTHKPNRNWETLFRFRYKEKGISLSSDDNSYPVGKREQTQLRLQTKFSPDKEWTFTTRVDWSKVDIQGKEIPNGIYMSQELRYQRPNGKWYAQLRYGIVDAEDYETRFYIYEPDVLYSFSVPMYYGQGHRIIAMLKYTILPKFDIWLRYGQWHYYNRTTISSGNNTINSNMLNEFRFQLRKSF